MFDIFTPTGRAEHLRIYYLWRYFHDVSQTLPLKLWMLSRWLLVIVQRSRYLSLWSWNWIGPRAGRGEMAGYSIKGLDHKRYFHSTRWRQARWFTVLVSRTPILGHGSEWARRFMQNEKRRALFIDHRFLSICQDGTRKRREAYNTGWWSSSQTNSRYRSWEDGYSRGSNCRQVSNCLSPKIWHPKDLAVTQNQNVNRTRLK
jgi:hypothetical protein